MRNWFEGTLTRRLLSLAVCAAMVFSLLPVFAFAEGSEGLCEHHPAHTPECGYVAAVAGQDCGHQHDESCGYREASPCTHQHTEECGEDGASCTHVHDDSCGYREASDCGHAHDKSCGYVEAVEGQPCGYVCAACAGEPQPEDPTDKVITGWAWVDPDEWLDETGSFAMPGVTEDTPAYFEDVVEYLPTQITADGETLTLGDWVCDDYPMETGTAWGDFTFETTLPEGYVLSEGGNVLRVGVTIAPLNLTEGPEAAAYDTVTNISYLDADGTKKTADCTAVTADYLSANNNTLSAGWYVVQGDVTIGTAEAPQRVTVSGDVHLILADRCNLIVNGGIQVQDNSTDSTSNTNALTLYAQSKGSTMGKLTAQNVNVMDAAIGGGYGAELGGSGDGGGTITINGGVITANSFGGAAIGGGGGKGQGGSGGTITISGGVVQAESTTGAAIGGGYGGSSGGSGGTITISGGIVEAKSFDGAAIGGGRGDGSGGGSGGTITISGGIVEAKSSDGAAIGGGHRFGFSGRFSTGTSGNAVIFASSHVVFIADQHGKRNNAWRGIIFEGGSGAVYGDQALTSDMTIAEGETLTVPTGTTLTIQAGVTLTNNGTIVSNGTIVNNGTIVGNGTITGNQPKVSVKYLEADGTEKTADCTAVTADYLSANSNTLSAGWYVAQGEVTIGTEEAPQRVTVSGDVHLILAEGCNLILNGGIQVEGSNALTLYAQSTEETTMGKLTTQNVDGNDAAIGGSSSGGSGGTITINGGIVEAESSSGAAIGGGYGKGQGGSSGTITINGGVVQATSNYGAAIGGGGSSSRGGSGGEITINGGVVWAGSTLGAAIGGGSSSIDGSSGSHGGSGGTIIINGGVVHADSTLGAAIGGGDDGDFGGGDGDSGSFSTGTNGNAVIFASSIADQSGKDNWGGVIFEGGAGKVYVSPSPTLPLGLPLGLPIPEKQSLTLDMNGKSLSFAQGTDITLNSGSALTLSGPGTFPGGISVSGGTLAGLLAEGWAYTRDGKYVPVSDETTLSEAINLSRITVKINTQPADVTMAYGEAKSLSVTAEPVTSGDTVTYQWYLGGSALTGETQSTLSLSTLYAGTHHIYCAVTCGGFTVNSDTAKVTVQPSPSYLDLTGKADFAGQTEVWVDGVAYPIQTEGNRRYAALPDTGDLLTIYTYKQDNSEADHENYPISMTVYRIAREETGAKVKRISAFNDLLQYSGCSIRVTGKRGIRMITALTKDNKNALKGAGLAGYTLEEYGTVVQWKDTLAQAGASLTLDTGNHNYAYKRGKADPVFANVGELTQYTNVLVWNSLTDAQVGQDIVMRPYIKLSKDGQTVTLYGGCVSRSIGYIAYQNRNVFQPGTAAYAYVWDIIHAVYDDTYDKDYKG